MDASQIYTIMRAKYQGLEHPSTMRVHEFIVKTPLWDVAHP